MDKKRVNILGVPFDRVTAAGALDRIIGELEKHEPGQFFVATPNPEMLLAALKEPDFMKILQSTGMNIADGIGILWASKYADYIRKNKATVGKIIKFGISLGAIIFRPSWIRRILPERVTGTDLMQSVCGRIGDSRGIFLLGGGPGVAEKTAAILKKRYNCDIRGTSDAAASASTDKQLQEQINKSGAKILFVAFGTPKQEIWIDRNLSHLHNIKMAIGVGGAFDFVSGTIRRAPGFMRKAGLEWLYRLIKQPSRVRRIINATVVFPLKVLSESLKQK